MGKIIDEALVQVELGLADSITDIQRGVILAAVQRAEGAVIRHLKYDPVQRVRTEYYPRYTPAISGAAVWEANSTDAYLRRQSTASSDELQLLHLPIRKTDADAGNSIDLRVDFDGRNGAKSGGFAAATQKTEGSDFWPNYDGQDSNAIEFCSDGILRSIGMWPEESGSVRVTYVGGYTANELNGQTTILDASPILDACLMEAANRARKALALKNRTRLGMIAGPLVSEKLGDYNYRLESSSMRALFGPAASLSNSSVEQLSGFVNWGVLGV